MWCTMLLRKTCLLTKTCLNYTVNLQVEQGLRPDANNELQCRYTKVELDGSNCSTELLRNHHTESNNSLHNEDNGSITHVDIAVKQISEGSSTAYDDGTRLLNCSRRALKTLLIAAAVCSLGIALLVLAVYLLGEYYLCRISRCVLMFKLIILCHCFMCVCVVFVDVCNCS